MKHPSIILVLAFLLLAFPDSFKAQSWAKSKKKKTQVVKKQSEEVQVKKIVTQVIDGFFVKREFLPIFQNLFTPCDKIDKEISQLNCELKEHYPFKFGKKLGFRAMAIGWRERFGFYYFILGTNPIKKISTDGMFFYDENYDKFRDEVLKKNDASFHNYDLNFDFKNLDKKQIEKKIDEIELSVNEIESLVFNRIDKTLYEKNIEIMKETIKVSTFIENNRKYHLAEIEDFVMGFFLTKRNGQLKIVGIGLKDND